MKCGDGERTHVPYRYGRLDECSFDCNILEFLEKRDLNSRNEGSGRLENELLRPQNELSNLKGGCHKQPPHHTIKRSPTSGKSTQPPTTRGFPSPMIILLDTTDICP